MLKKFLSTFIAVFTLITVVATSVYADFSITDFYPQTKELYSGKFDDADIDTTHMVITDNDTTPDATKEFDVYEDPTNAELVMGAFETTTGSKTVAVWPSGYDVATAAGTNTKIDDHLVISFDISRYAASGKVLQIGYGLYGSGGTRSGPYLQWKDSDLTLTDHDNSSLNIHSNLTLATDEADNYHNFAFIIDSSCVASLYIDGVLVRENIVQRDDTLRGKELTNFNFYFAKNASYTNQTVKVKNFKVYAAAEAGIVKDIKAITAQNLTSETPDESGNYVLTQNLTLPTEGAGGSTITWSSSNEAIISSDGTIHRHSGYEKSDAVTLTANIVNGEVEVSKNFTFYVKRKDFAAAADMDGDYIVYDDFSNSNLAGRGLFSTSTVSDGKLVMENNAGKTSTSSLYFTPNNTSLASQNKYVIDFDMTLNKDVAFRIDVWAHTGDGKRFNRLNRMAGKGNLYLSEEYIKDIASGSDAKIMSDVDIFETNTTMNFKYLIDTISQKFSLYVNDALLVKDCYRNLKVNGCGGLDFEYPNASIMTIDNLKVYKLADGAVFAPESSAKTISLNGENVSKIDATGTYAAKLNITDFTTDYTDDTDFVAALYNKSTNELSSVKVVKATALKGTVRWNEAIENYGLYAKTTVDVPADYENYYIKLMHWNGNVPVSASVTVD